MTVAVDRPKSSAGERVTDFLDVTAWRQSAEFAATYLHKGRLVLVEGKLQTRTWQTQDGSKRKAWEIVCDDLRGLDRPRESAGSGGGKVAPPEARPEPLPETAIEEVGPGAGPPELEDPFADE
jgi:single-strand DNA-binding protein